MESEGGKRAASIPKKMKSVDGSVEEYRASGASGQAGAATSSTLKPTLSSAGGSCDTSPVTPSVFTEPPSPADVRVLDDLPSTPYASSDFDTPRKCPRACFVGRAGEEDDAETPSKEISLSKSEVRVEGAFLGKNEPRLKYASPGKSDIRLKDAPLGENEAGGVQNPAMPACFQSFLYSDGESGSDDPSDGASSGASTSLVIAGRNRLGHRTRPGGSSPSSLHALGECAPRSMSSVKEGFSRSGGRPESSEDSPTSPAALDEAIVPGGVGASSSLHHSLRTAVGNLKKANSKAEVAQEGKEKKPLPPPPPAASSVPLPLPTVGSLAIVCFKSSGMPQEGVEDKTPETSHEGRHLKLHETPQEQGRDRTPLGTPPTKMASSGRIGDDTGAIERGRYQEKLPSGEIAAATVNSQESGDNSLEKQQWKRWIENDKSSSDDTSSHGKQDQEKEKEGPLNAPPRPDLHPSRLSTLETPKRSADTNRKPGSPVFQHGKGIRSIQRNTLGSMREASSVRDVGRKTSRVTHRSLSPKSGAGSTRAVLGRRRFSRVSPPRGGEAPDREATAAEMFTGVALCHEVSGGSQSLAGEDTTSEQSGAGAAQNRRWLPRLQPANDKVSAAIRAIGVLNNEKGAGKFDMLASNASFSDSDGSSSEINVCDFLEEASCSDVKSASEDTGCGIPLGGGGGVGHLAKAYLRGAGSDHNDEENPQGLHMGTLDEQEIAFLAESRELREALLGVEDLSFGKLPLIRQVELIRDLSTVHFASGDVIFREGEPSDTLYISIDPTASVFQHEGKMMGLGLAESKGKVADSECEIGGSEEDDRTRASVPPGRIFGEHGLLYSAAYNRPATVQAAVNMSCAVLHAPAFPRWSEFRVCLLIKKVPLLAGLSPVAQNLIIDSINFRDFEPGELIVREGERAEAFFMITSGMVAVTRTIRNEEASVSGYSGSGSSEGIPDITPRTADGDDFMGAFAGFAAQQSLSAPSTPETYGDGQPPDVTAISANDAANTHGVAGEIAGADSSNTKGVVVGTREGDDCIPHRATAEITERGDSNPHRVNAGSMRDDQCQVTADISEGAVSNPYGVLDEASVGDAFNTRGMASETREHVPSNTLGETVEGSGGASGGSRSSDPRNASERAAPMLGTTAPGSGVPQRRSVCDDTAADEGVLFPNKVDADTHYQELKGPEPATDDESRLFPESNYQSPNYVRELPLTRLYEGTFFGEMALIYDEPRNANVRAATKVTCIYLLKEDFMTCLADKSFHELMERTALRTACTRETRDKLDKQARIAKAALLWRGDRLETRPHPAPKQFGLLRCKARSSFRRTLKMTRGGGKTKESREKMVNKYRVCNKVGEGSFGEVFKVVHTETNTVYAMKVITRPRKGRRKEHLESSLKREVSVLKRIRHPNIVTLWEAISDPRSRKVYLIQEFMEGGPLLKEEYIVEPLAGDVAIAKFIQAARGVHYIHRYGVCHGDIKPSNILQDAYGRVKIADLGACVILRSDKDGGASGDSGSSGSSVGLRDSEDQSQESRRRYKKRRQRLGGTPGFQAPELFGEGGVSRTSFASDVWALGVSLYQMVVGRMPFYGSSYRELMLSIQMEAAVFPTSCHVQPNLVNLLHRMLDKNPSTRITLAEAMQHESVTREGACNPRWEGEEFAHNGVGGGYEALSEWARLTIVRGQSSRERRKPEALERREEGRSHSPDTSVGKRSSRFQPRASLSAQDLPHGELDDSTALKRSSRLVRKPDFLMPRNDPFCQTTGRVVLSNPHASGCLRASHAGEIGTRRLSLLSKLDGSDADPVDPSSSSAHGGGGINVYWTWNCRDFYDRQPERYLEINRRRSTGSARSPKFDRGGLTYPLIGEQVEADSKGEGNPRWLRGQHGETASGEPVPHMYTAASLLLPIDVDDTAAHQHPPESPPSNTSNSDPADSEDVRAWGRGVINVAQGVRGGGRRRSDGPRDGASRVVREERRLPLFSLRTPVASVSLDLSMDRINEEDPRILDNQSGRNIPTSDPQTLSSNADKSWEEDSGQNVNTASPKPPCKRTCERTESGGGDDATGEPDTQERKPSHQRVPSASEWREPQDADHRDSDSDRASSSHQLPRSDRRAIRAVGDGVEVGLGAGAWARGTEKSQRSGIDREDNVKKGSASSGEEGKSGGGKWENMWSGSNSSENSDDDGIGSETLVVDITENLAEIGEGAKHLDDDELLALDREEIINLSGDAFPGGSSANTASTGDSAGSAVKNATTRTSASRSSGKKTSIGHVQARVWAGQVNLDVEVRFGLSLNQGNRRDMEDTASFVADACGLRQKRLEAQQHSEDLSTTSPAATATVTSTGDTTSTPKHAAAYFGVYDGHGGPEVAAYLEQVLHNHVLDDPLFPSDIPKAISNACLATDLECLEVSRRKHLMDTEEQPGKEPAQEDNSLKKQMIKQDYSGAVAVMAIIHRPPSGAQPSSADPGSFIPSADSRTTAGGRTIAAAGIASQPATKDTAKAAVIDTPVQTQKPPQHRLQHGHHHPVFLHVANVGDCRGVLCRGGTAVPVTEDHTPSIPREAARVEGAGGFVSRGRVNGILGVSRSFGDIHCKVYPPREGNDLWEEQQVISRPDVHSIQITKADNFLILACDGVWDVLSNQEAVSYVHRRLLIHRDVQRAAVELVNKAVETSSDNCSCIVICLNQHTSHRKQRSSRTSLSSVSSGGSSEVVTHR